MRSAVYAAADPRKRRAAHRALAAALGERRPDRRAWHLAAATMGPDEEIAAALEQAAETARRRSGYTAAARMLERAAELTPPGAARAVRLAGAAEAARQAGRGEHALALFAEALRDTSDTARRAQIEHQRGRIELFRGRAPRGQELLMLAADLMVASDPERAATLFIEVAPTALYTGDTVGALAAAERARALAGGRGGLGELVSELVVGLVWYWLGDRHVPTS